VRVGIVGAGSIGNHLAYSARKLNWEVTVFDRDTEALSRFKEDIFPSRYGRFDSEIVLKNSEDLSHANLGSFEMILIGTPPDTHLDVLRIAVKLKPRAIFIEKPFCPPTESQIFESKHLIEQNSSIDFFCGYNHRLSLVTRTLLDSIQLTDPHLLALEVNWLESWDGILRAHPWIGGPGETYLGSTEKGGGALFEHSHGLDLWIQISKALGLGLPNELRADMKIVKSEKENTDYDECVKVEIVTDKGFSGEINQDVLTNPSKKEVKVLCKNHRFLAAYGKEGHDSLRCEPTNGTSGGFSLDLEKPRPTDFDTELALIDKIMSKKLQTAPTINIDALSGLYTAYVAKRAVDSSKLGTSVQIDSKEWELL